MSSWYLDYLGKPWASVPNPPASYNCVILCASIYKDRFGIEVGDITRDADNFRECLAGFSEAEKIPDIWGLVPLSENERPREFDTVFMARSKYQDHCGIMASTPDGLLVLHCIRDAGVILDAPMDMAMHGISKLTFYRRRGTDEGM
jgi:hypothetical protein